MAIIRIAKKFKEILTYHQRKRVIQLFFLMIIGGFMEMLSVSVMLVFMDMAMDLDDILNNPIVLAIYNILGVSSAQSMLVLIAVLMACLYLAKNIFLLFQMTVQEKFVQYNCFLTQKKLMNSFLNRPYEFYLSAKSGEIIRVVTKDTQNAYSALNNVISLVSELVVSFILMITVFVIAPVLTIMLGGVLSVVTAVIYLFGKRRLKKSGGAANRASAGMNQTLLQSIQGIKEIKILRKEQYFQDVFDKDGMEYVKSVYIGQLYGKAPRFLLEAFAMVLMFLSFAYLIYSGVEIASLIPAISGIGMASIRLLPSLNRISLTLANATYYEPSVDKLIENITKYIEDGEKAEGLEDLNQEESITSFEYLNLKDVNYHYPSSDSNVVNHADLTIKRGDFVGVVGASGAGKTTIADIMLGLLNPQSGKVSVNGADISADIEGWLGIIGYIPQNIFMLDGSIRENIAFGVEKNEIDNEKVWKALKDAALEEYVKKLPEGIDTQIGERGIRISGGQKQRIGIARALYNNPEVLFLDEATSALDNTTENSIIESIEHLHGKKTLIIIAHRLTTIEKCDYLYKVEDGRIVKMNNLH